MARILAPLLSIRSWGTIAKSLTFRRRKALTDALKTPIPTDAKTAIQRAQRLLFQDAIAWWHALSGEEKLAYDAPGRAHHMSGYAYFIKTYLLNPPAATFLSLTDTPAIYTGEAGHSPMTNPAEDALIWGTIKEYASGIVDIPTQSRARAWLTAAQTFTPFTSAKVLLNAISFDEHNEFDEVTNHRFTATEYGFYVGTGCIRWDGAAADKQWWTRILKNGSIVTQANFQTAAIGYICGLTGDIFELDAGDYLELWGIHLDVANRVATAGTSATFMAIHKLS